MKLLPRPAARALDGARGGVIVDAYRKWSADQAARLAAALSFYTAFSLAPLVLITASLLGLLLGPQAAQGLISERLAQFIGSERALAVEGLLAAADRPEAGGLAGLIGFAMLLWTGSAVVRELQESLNQIFAVRHPQEGWWPSIRRKLVSLAFVLGMGCLMLAAVGVSAAAAAAGKYFGGALGYEEGVLQAFNQAATFVVITALFTAMYRFLPDARIRFRDLLLGGAFTAAFFTLGNYLLGLYLGRKGASSAYGAAGSLMAFLLWTYYCAQIIYFGAEFLYAWAERRGDGVRQRHPPLEDRPTAEERRQRKSR